MGAADGGLRGAGTRPVSFARVLRGSHRPLLAVWQRRRGLACDATFFCKVVEVWCHLPLHGALRSVCTSPTLHDAGRTMSMNRIWPLLNHGRWRAVCTIVLAPLLLIMLFHAPAQAAAFCSSCADGSSLVPCAAGCKTQRRLRELGVAKRTVKFHTDTSRAIAACHLISISMMLSAHEDGDFAKPPSPMWALATYPGSDDPVFVD